MDKEKTGRLIRTARNGKGLTQLELGDLIGVSNKAVSRWENGESFPDVALLDSLSSTLGLQIEEIVRGEKSEASENQAFEEIVQEVKLQRKRQTRRIFGTFAIGTITLFLLIMGWRMFSGKAFEWSRQFLFIYGVISGLTVVVAMRISVSTGKPQSKKLRVLGVISLVSGIYLFLAMLIMGSFFQNGFVSGRVMPEQMNALYVLQLLFVLYLFLRMMKMEAVSVTHLLVGEAVLFAIMAYVDILQRVDLVGPEYFYRVLLDTMSIAVISGIACVVARVWRRNHRA